MSHFPNVFQLSSIPDAFVFTPLQFNSTNPSFASFNTVVTDAMSEGSAFSVPQLSPAPAIISPVVPSSAGKARRKKKIEEGDADIEVVPCKICGDKSSGVHYGVITCEGCKGFFRRSQTAARPFECQANQNCAIDRTNRNRCQYCRWKKCIELGMSRDAVKFGRMSKKQREKVEGEVNMHKQLKVRGSNSMEKSGGAVNVVVDAGLDYQNGQLSNGSTEQTSLHETTALVKSENCTTQSSNGATSGYAAYNSSSPVSSGYSSSHTSSPTPSNSLPPMNGSGNTTHSLPETTLSSNGHEAIASGSPVSGTLAKQMLAAHEQTSLYTPEQRQQLKLLPLDYGTIWKYKNMGQADWWSHGASELTPMLQQIVEFAKLVPGFMKLSQDDQIVLLKGGAMDVAIVRMTTMYDLRSHTVLYGGVYIPVQLFQSNDQVEMKFIYDLFSFVRELSSFSLTETEIALYSAMVLMWPHRTTLKNAGGIHAVYQRLSESLESELRSSHGDHNGILFFQRMRALAGNLQNISAQHSFILGQFIKLYPHIVLPPLYKEIFISDHL